MKARSETRERSRRHGNWWLKAVLLGQLLLLFLHTANVVTVSAQDCSAFATPAVIKGKKIFNSLTGTYIPIKGVNYYPRPNAGELVQTNSIDFFTESYRAVWERDIIYFTQLHVNVVRIYAISPGQNHDGFMCALQAAGMYLMVGLAADCLDCAISSADAPNCYSAELKARGQFIIAEFARYDNVLAFSAGNEASLVAGSSVTNGPCQKQFIRDMRAFIQSCNSTIRHIPVGLEIADFEREAQALWYGCRSDVNDELENAEFVGINAYQDCDGTVTSVDQLIGYEQMLADFASYKLTVPVIVTEFGCINPSFATIDGYEAQRNFLQVEALFSQQYQAEFVGGAVFEYSTELINSLSSFPFTTYGEGNWGIGYFSPENCDDIDVPCVYVPFPQFATLAAKYAAVDTSFEPNMADYSFEQAPPTCPSQFAPLASFTWAAAATADLACPGINFVTCPGVPSECSHLGVGLLAPTATAPAPSTIVAPTLAPANTTAGKPVAAPTPVPANTTTGTPVKAPTPANTTTAAPKTTVAPTPMSSVAPTLKPGTAAVGTTTTNKPTGATNSPSPSLQPAILNATTSASPAKLPVSSRKPSPAAANGTAPTPTSSASSRRYGWLASLLVLLLLSLC